MQSYILPGVGAYAAAMTKVESLSIIESLTEQVRIRKKPFLGICVGMQLLSNVGKEFVEYPGLGYIAGSVEKLKTEPYDLPLPHIGWNNLHIEKNGSLLFKDMAEEPHFYFVHSYHFIPEEPNVISATCDYGCTFAAAIEQDNIFGVQFHPEKSQYDGLQLLKNFAAIS